MARGMVFSVNFRLISSFQMVHLRWMVLAVFVRIVLGDKLLRLAGECLLG